VLRDAAIYSQHVSDIVVMKFGGTSVADAERIKRAARRIVDKREAGCQVVAVLSARGKTTDELIGLAEEVSAAPDPREMDMLLSSGERISCALCAMAINDLGHRAISLTGSQAGIVTDESHTRARIIDVRADRIRSALAEDSIVLVAGFQGVSSTARLSLVQRCARSTLMFLACLALTRGSSRTRASWTRFRLRRCSRWLLLARGCCNCARSSMPAIMACVSTVVRHLATRPVPLCWRKRTPWSSL
jgi:hypothetical protein